MKALLTITILLTNCLFCKAQFRNDHWFWCTYPWETNELGPWKLSHWNPISLVHDSGQQTPVVHYGSISKIDGSSHYYFDGNNIRNTNGYTVFGDTVQNPAFYQDGGPDPLPAFGFMENDPIAFIKYELHVDTVWNVNSRSLLTKIRVYWIDPNYNNNQGKVLRIDTISPPEHIYNQFSISTCRHANGRDWWFFIQDYWGEGHWNKSLITPLGASPLEPFILEGDTGIVTYSAQFSRNGSKFALLSYMAFPPGPSQGYV